MSPKIYQSKTEELAIFAKALAHPARLEILKTLAEKQRCMCGEIVDVMPLAQSTVSQHLKELKNCGLINGEIEGSKSCYCINYDNFKKFADYLNSFMTNVCCSDFKSKTIK